MKEIKEFVDWEVACREYAEEHRIEVCKAYLKKHNPRRYIEYFVDKEGEKNNE